MLCWHSSEAAREQRTKGVDVVELRNFPRVTTDAVNFQDIKTDCADSPGECPMKGFVCGFNDE